MSQKRLLWQLFPYFIIVTVFSLIISVLYSSESFKSSFLDRTRTDLISRAHLIENYFYQPIMDSNSIEADSLCRLLGTNSSTRITIILPSGKVIGDTEKDPDQMDNHADRPEIIAAGGNNFGSSIRFSHTLQENMMYVAVPVRSNVEISGFLRVAISISTIDGTLNALFIKIALAGIVIILFAALISLFISHRISKPLEEITSGAKLFASGELNHKLPIYNSREIGRLAEAMNQMAAQMNDRIETIAKQSNEREAVLSSMVEGVLAVDTDERLIGFNQAAGRLLGITSDEAKGKTLHEIVRNIDLQIFMMEVLGAREIVEKEILIHRDGEMYIRVHGTVLRDLEGNGIGVLIVLNDITKLHRLETVRRDFVANVSHELKTPVTSIKGFVETLLEGAMDNPDEARKFLEIIVRQADRLNAIIDDLLTLSRIEQDCERSQISFAISKLRPVLESAIQTCELNAQQKNINIDLKCDTNLTSHINAHLLEQACINLIDNAIKYSDENSTIEIKAMPAESEILIEVSDHGCGIAGKHLPRLFERFYLVDKARGRKLGGTGLGLAIVKHITQIHGGYPSVESYPGRGSTFTIHLPDNKTN